MFVGGELGHINIFLSLVIDPHLGSPEEGSAGVACDCSIVTPSLATLVTDVASAAAGHYMTFLPILFKELYFSENRLYSL